MTPELKLYRRLSGWAMFQRKCPLIYQNNRLVKSYRVPGTQDYGHNEMFAHQFRSIEPRTVSNIRKFFGGCNDQTAKMAA